MKEKKIIKELREKLHKTIEVYGLDSKKVLNLSQRLDRYIVKEMLKNKYIQSINLKKTKRVVLIIKKKRNSSS